MVALTAGRSTPRRENDAVESHPAKGGVKIQPGSLVCLDANGWAQPGAAGATLTAVGRAEHGVDNTAGGNGDARVRTRRGVFQFANSAAGDQVTRADIGKLAYVVDDQTVAKTNGGGARSVAGIIRDVDALGVWVQF